MTQSGHQSPQGLPELTFPRIMFMVTDHLAPQPLEQGQRPPPTDEWKVGDNHPYVSDMRIVAMFRDGDVIEVYSMSSKSGGMRDVVPLSRVRLIQEVMPPEVFAEELAHAELGYPDDDDPDDPEDPEELPSPSPRATSEAPS